DLTAVAIAKVLPPEASQQNPVDTIATAGAQQYQACSTAMYCDPEVDGLVIIFVSPVMIDAVDIASAIVAGIAEGRSQAGDGKPVLTCFMGKHHGDEGIAILHAAGIPVFEFPEAAIESLSAMARYGAIRDEPLGEVPVLTPAPRQEEVREILNSQDGWVRFPDVMRILTAYGISVAPWAIVDSAEAAIEFAEETGYPIVLKIDSDTLLHKTEHGAVRLDLRRSQDIRGAFAEISANIENISGDHQFVVQSMLRGDAEILIGATIDPAFGHLVAFGLGGIFAEIMKDVAFRIHPLTDREATAMIRSIRGCPLLDGARGGQAVDIEGLADVLLRVSQLVGDFPEIAELDINPFLAHADSERQAAVDARIRVVRDA
ncbi:MAG: acetate--CoA ligase family protein, partial [Kofleriaceae bacterium]|nr:acetate--CoA ligase family protein [Kofleriaceae bacterium]